MDPHPFIAARALPLVRPAPRHSGARGAFALVLAALLAAAFAGAVSIASPAAHATRSA